MISPAGTGLIDTTATSRVSYGLSRYGYIPSVSERTDRRGVPWARLITSASVLMHAGAPLALAVLRSRLPDAERPY